MEASKIANEITEGLLGKIKEFTGGSFLLLVVDREGEIIPYMKAKDMKDQLALERGVEIYMKEVEIMTERNIISKIEGWSDIE